MELYQNGYITLVYYLLVVINGVLNINWAKPPHLDLRKVALSFSMDIWPRKQTHSLSTYEPAFEILDLVVDEDIFKFGQWLVVLCYSWLVPEPWTGFFITA